MKHLIVYAESGVYAGWPANHGAWQWGDEFLVGFLTGRYGQKSMHYCHEPFVKKQARSLDGGETWVVEDPGVDFECRHTTSPPKFNLAHSIIRVCGIYDHGGDYCVREGGFYLSHDRGHTWQGGHSFTGLESMFVEPMHCTARTAVLGDFVFLSNAHENHWGTDNTFVAQHDGEQFHFRSWLTPGDKGRAVMPAVARVGNRIVAVLRCRTYHVPDCWLDAYASDDDGNSWHYLAKVDDTGGHNGNPPALIALPDGRLVCAYANRTMCEIRVMQSTDGGQTWQWPHLVLRMGRNDIGYPRLFLRTDGAVACVYYFANREIKEQHIACTIFTP